MLAFGGFVACVYFGNRFLVLGECRSIFHPKCHLFLWFGTSMFSERVRVEWMGSFCVSLLEELPHRTVCRLFSGAAIALVSINGFEAGLGIYLIPYVS